MEEQVVTNFCKRRGVAKLNASVTRLITQVANLKEEIDVSTIENAPKQLLTRLQEASAEFKEAHMSSLNTIDDDGAIASEQAVLDSLLDSIDGLATCLQNLIDSAAKPKEVHECKDLVICRNALPL